MSDQAEITTLVHAYAGGSTPAISRVWPPSSSRPLGAPNRLERCVEEGGGPRSLRTRVPLRRSPRTKHLITNLTIDVEPDVDRAAAECCFTVLQGIEAGEPIQIILSGRYVDRFERSAGVWRFSDRLFIVDLTGDLGRHFTVRFGFAVPAYGPNAQGQAIRDLLVAGDELGFDSAWFPDHIAVPDYATA